MRRLSNILTNILLGICILLIIAFAGVRLFGYVPFVIMSGSMADEYPVGSVVYTKEIEPELLEPGDDVSFRLQENTVATHRIREVDIEKRQIWTYGTNNKDSEGNQINDAEAIGFDDIIGRVDFSLPLIGHIYLYTRTTMGKAIFILGVAGVMVILQILKKIAKIKEEEEL